MDLETWMAKHNVVDQQISTATGIARSYITRIRNGDVNVSLESAVAIWDYTDREIDITQLLHRAKRPGAAPAKRPAKIRKRPARRVSKSREAA